MAAVRNLWIRGKIMQAGNIMIMKRFIALITALILLHTVGYCSGISVVIDNEPVAFDTAPIIYNERTMVPMRQIFEQLGCGIEWLGESKTVIAAKNNLLVAMQIGSNKVIKTDIEKGTTEVIESDTAPIIHNERTMIPVRVISEALGYEVLWDAENNAVVILQSNTETN